jgi:DeoR family transcriptional regulator, glycerol-3-phosphate regulon repressor
MRPTVRQTEILKLVREQGACAIGQLAEQLKVSDETIRRNVKPLVSEGLVDKVHGGIVLPDQDREPPIHKRMRQYAEAKKRIAALVARGVRNGDSLMIDTGSTTAYVAHALVDHSDLVVVTNSPYIAGLLAARNGNRVFMAGGELRAHDGAAFGPETIAFVRRFEVRHAILSMGAIHADKGCMYYHLCEAEYSRAIIDQAEQVTVAADRTKFGRTSLVKVCELAEIDALVTDQAPEPGLARRLQEAEVELGVA